MPCHAFVPMPAKPSSASVGTSGSSASRDGIAVASAFILPARICGSVEARLRNATCVSPARIEGIICPAPPLYGTCVISYAVFCLKKKHDHHAQHLHRDD